MTGPDFVIDESRAVARGMEADSARNLLRNGIETIMAQALAWHEQPADLRSEAPHSAIKITTGVGKSELIRQELIARFIGEAKARELPHRVLIGVPTHKLADEAKHKMPAGITAMVWQGRGATKLGTDEPMCRNLDAVNAALALGADVEETACKSKEACCPFYDNCHYQAQKPVARASDVVLFAHECLFAVPKEASEKVGLVIADESFWQDGLRGTDTESKNRLAIGCLAHELSGFPVRHRGGIKNDLDTEHLYDLLERLDRALVAMPDGYVKRAPLFKAGFLPATNYEDGSCEIARQLEWLRWVEHGLRPGAGAEKLQAVVKQFGFLGQLPRRAFMWWALGDLLNGNDDATGRLLIETVTTKEGTQRWLRLLERREIDKRIAKLPIVVSDATMPLEIVRHYLPSLQIALELEVAAPHTRTTQVTGLPAGKSSLEPKEAGRRSAGEEARIGRKRQRLAAWAKHVAQGRPTLVVTYQAIEDDFKGIAGVETTHWNAFDGIDKWHSVDVIVVIGRPLPGPAAIQRMAATVTGRPVTVRKEDWVQQDRGIRLTDGTEQTLRCKFYGVPEAEMIRRAVCETAVIQAVGRGRGVNRTSVSPLEVYLVLDDTVVDGLPVDELLDLKDIEPGSVDRMVDRGLVPQFGGDARRLYPELFKSRNAANQAYRRAGVRIKRSPSGSVELVTALKRSSLKSVSPVYVRYRPKGRGSESRLAWVDHAKVPDARAVLEAAMGPLEQFEVLPEPESEPTAAKLEPLAAAGGGAGPGGGSEAVRRIDAQRCEQVRTGGTMTRAETAGPEPRTAKADAMAFLQAALAGEPVPAAEVGRRAHEHGLTAKAIRSAREALGVEIERDGFGPGSKSLWALPGDHGADTEAPMSDENGDRADPHRRPRTKDGFEVIGPEPGKACSQCGKREGAVLLIRDPRQDLRPKLLHEGCAAAWYYLLGEVPAAGGADGAS